MQKSSAMKQRGGTDLKTLPCRENEMLANALSSSVNSKPHASPAQEGKARDCCVETKRADDTFSSPSSIYAELEAEATGSRDGLATQPGEDDATQKLGLGSLLASDAGVMVLNHLSLREIVQLLSATSKEIARLPASCRGAWMLSLLRERLGEVLKIDSSSFLCLDRGAEPPTLLGELGSLYMLAANIILPCVSMRDVEEETTCRSVLLTACQRLTEEDCLQQSTCGSCLVNKLSLKRVPSDRIGTVVEVDEAYQVLASVSCTSAQCKYQLILKLSACERCCCGLTLGGVCGCCGSSARRCEPCKTLCSKCSSNLCTDCALYGPEPETVEQEHHLVFCTDCGYVCDGCINAYSYNDGVVCDECEEIACITCWNGALCHACEEVKCTDCDTMLHCGSCYTVTCTSCAEDSICAECGLPICGSCGVHHEL